MENKLAAFIASLATSPRKLEEYQDDAEAAMAAAGLSDDEKAVLRSGDWQAICEFMGDDGPRPVMAHGNPPGGGGGDDGDDEGGGSG